MLENGYKNIKIIRRQFFFLKRTQTVLVYHSVLKVRLETGNSACSQSDLSRLINIPMCVCVCAQLYASADAQGNPTSDRTEIDRQPAVHSAVRTKTDRHQLGDRQSDQQTQRFVTRTARYTAAAVVYSHGRE